VEEGSSDAISPGLPWKKDHLMPSYPACRGRKTT